MSFFSRKTRRNALVRSFRRTLTPRLETLEDRCVPANISWDGGGGNSNWHNPLNWSTDTVPGAADDVQINNGTVSVTDSAVTVSGLSLLGGELTGSADVTVDGLFTWTRGTLSGTGALNANGGMLITGGVDPITFKSLDGRTLNNAGTAIWSAGHIVAFNGAVINNLAGATFETQSQFDLAWQYPSTGKGGQGARAMFHNFGTLLKSGDTPVPDGIYDLGYGTGIDAIFENAGAVDVQAGGLWLSNLGRDIGYITTGDFVVCGTGLELIGGDLAASASVHAGNSGLSNLTTDGEFAVAGTTIVRSGTVTFRGPAVSLGDLTVYGAADVSTVAPSTATGLTIRERGVLTGTADLSVSGLFTWIWGTLSGTGALNANGGMLITGGVDPITFKSLDGRTLNNAGTAIWSAGHIVAFNGAVINNLAGATFETQSQFDLAWQYPSTGKGGQGARAMFHNFGTLLKSGDTPVPDGIYDLGYGTGIDAIFENAGALEARIGSLFLTSYTQTNGTTVLSGGTIGAPSLDFQGGRFTGFGPVFGNVSNGGQAQPGSPLGSIAVNGNYAQNAAGSLQFELGGLAIAQFDQLNVFGGVTLGGALNLSLIGGFAANIGNAFTLLNNDGGDAIVGTFAGVPENGLVTFAGYEFRISYVGGTGNDLVATCVAVPNTPPTAMGQAIDVPEDGEAQMTLAATDAETLQGQLVFTIHSVPAAGTLYNDANIVHAGDIFTGPPTLRYVAAAGCDATQASFTFTVTDSGGLFSDAATVTVTIIKAVPDGAVTIDGSGVVRIGGTSGDDAIVLTSGSGHLLRNGIDTAIPIGNITEIRVWGRTGNDTIDVSGLNIRSFINAGDGNDTLISGGGDDVIFGGAGDDTITGGAGNDFLIGGTGKDRIGGSAGNDILVAGEVDCSLSLAALRAISLAWTNSRTVTDEAIDDFMDETFGDTDSDSLTGGSGADLFIIDSGDAITDFQFGKPKTNKDGDVVIKDGVVVS